MTTDLTLTIAGSSARARVWGSSTIISATLFALGAILQTWLYQSPLPVLFAVLIAIPVLLALYLRVSNGTSELTIFLRSYSIGLFAAGIASYYAIALFDPFQLSSDASSFFELASQAGPPRSIEDLRTITEGAGAVVLWSWFYDIAAMFGIPREPYVGISINVLIVAMASIICMRSARHLYGDDTYRAARLTLFFTISGTLWLFAGVHIRDSVIFLVITLLIHFWIAFLAQVDMRRIALALVVTVVSMVVLEVLRREFFYIPLVIALAGLVSLNFSRGRGDSRFIMLVSIVVGLGLAGAGLIVFGDQIQTSFLSGQETYTSAAIEESRSGSLGTTLIVEQSSIVRLLIGVPYLFYFPIPFWNGFSGESAILFFKSINALAFYLVSAFAFVGVLMVALNHRLRSPAFVFVALVPFALSAMIALTSLESRHLGAFLAPLFLIGLIPDLREPVQNRVFRFTLLLVLLVMAMVHAAWFSLRFA